MGLMFRRRRPVARLAVGAATAGVAYHAGKNRAQQNAVNEQAQSAYDATQGQQYAPPPHLRRRHQPRQLRTRQPS